MSPDGSQWILIDPYGTPPGPQDHTAPNSRAVGCQGDASLHSACLPGLVLANTPQPNILLTLPSVSSLIINSSLGESGALGVLLGLPRVECARGASRLRCPAGEHGCTHHFLKRYPQARPGQATQLCSPLSVSQQFPISPGAPQSLLLGFPYSINFFRAKPLLYTRRMHLLAPDPTNPWTHCFPQAPSHTRMLLPTPLSPLCPMGTIPPIILPHRAAS